MKIRFDFFVVLQIFSAFVFAQTYARIAHTDTRGSEEEREKASNRVLIKSYKYCPLAHLIAQMQHIAKYIVREPIRIELYVGYRLCALLSIRTSEFG